MITIAWDVDDVLNDLMFCWLIGKWLPDHPGCKVNFDQITENPPERILCCTLEEYLLSLDDFRLSGKYSVLKPNPQILNWFKESGHKCRHIALTSVPLKAADISASWTIKHYGKWIRSFNFVPSLRGNNFSPEYDSTKSDFLKCFRVVDVLVDDNKENIDGANKSGIKGILVKKPWNKAGLSFNDILTQIDKLL